MPVRVRPYVRRRFVNRVPGHIRRPRILATALDDLRIAGIERFSSLDVLPVYMSHAQRGSDFLDRNSLARMMQANQVSLGIRVIERDGQTAVWGWR